LFQIYHGICVPISIQIKKDMIKLLQKQNGAVFLCLTVYNGVSFCLKVGLQCRKRISASPIGPCPCGPRQGLCFSLRIYLTCMTHHPLSSVVYGSLWNGLTEWLITSRQTVWLYATWRWSSDQRFYAALREKKLRLWSSLYQKDLTISSYSPRYLTPSSSSELPVSSSKHRTVNF